MTFSFRPQRLNSVKEYICVQHPLEREVPQIVQSDELRKLINEIVKLELYQIKSYAMALSDNDLMKVTGYIPHNYYGVKLDNLFRIFGYRSSKALCIILYKEWQSSYNHVDCNRFISDQLNDNEHLIMIMREMHFGEELFRNIVVSKNIPIQIGKKCLVRRIPETEKNDLESKASYYGIDNDTVLFHDIELLFYTFCGRDDYISANLFRLKNTISKYNDDIIIIFVNNFLSCLSLNDLDAFNEIGLYLDQRFGDVESERCRNIFSNSPASIWEKYHNWIIRIKINEVFGNDERSRFWRQYRFVSKPKKYKQSNSVSMEFENYYVVEFLGQANGPMYFYKKDVFNQKIYRYMTRENNTELRQTLYHLPELYEHRKAHQGYWQSKINRLLIRNHITEKLDLSR